MTMSWAAFRSRSWLRVWFRRERAAPSGHMGDGRCSRSAPWCWRSASCSSAPRNIAPGILRAGRCSAPAWGPDSTTRPSPPSGISTARTRGAITGVTLLGGFASTVCWPLSAYLVEHFGWRATCLVYAALWAAVALPLYLVALPRRRPVAATVGAPAVATASREARHGDGVIFVVLAMVLTISAAILATMGSHLVLILQARGLDLAGAVALGMLIGPSAVGARFIEMLSGSRYPPIWTMTASVGLVALGVCLFLTGPSLFAAAIVLYASGNGIGSIAKGTLPLALFGAERYPALAGRLAPPLMFSMALAPFGGGAGV